MSRYLQRFRTSSEKSLVGFAIVSTTTVDLQRQIAEAVAVKAAVIEWPTQRAMSTETDLVAG